MITTLDCFKEMIVAPARRVGARVELYESSTLYQNATLLNVFSHEDHLQSFSVERMGENSKFFGFGVCQKLQATILDKERQFSIQEGNFMEVEFGAGCEYMYPYPLFRVEDVKRDENTNSLTVVAYDPIYDSVRRKVSEIELKDYTIFEFATACAALMGLPLKIENVPESVFSTSYPAGANFDGSETLREALNAIAEATQTIYFINHEWKLTFKRLNYKAEPVFTIPKSKYFSLDSKVNRTLTSVCHATELGDNVEHRLSEGGTTQYVRNNPFWELRDDVATLVENAAAAMGGITINQFNCDWRGDFSLEIGDKISLTTKDDQLITGYVINDTITYNGGLKENTYWDFIENDGESSTNPTSLGEALKNTYARVDKVNQRVDIVAQKADEAGSSVAALQLETDVIRGSVEEVALKYEDVDGKIGKLTERVDLQLTSDAVQIQIDKTLESGVSKVQTSTGFTFDEEGLTVSKSGSEMETTITEDGMAVKRSGEEVLTANSAGVIAVDLKAVNYLIIGNSRFEDYGSNRTGCFWIGG